MNERVIKVNASNPHDFNQKVIAENLTCSGQNLATVASVVKAEIKEEPLDLDDLNDQDLESDPEEEECYRIIEETVVDVSTLPGRIILKIYLIR